MGCRCLGEGLTAVGKFSLHRPLARLMHATACLAAKNNCLAAKIKCLAESNRTRTESKATNKCLHPRHPRSADRGRVSQIAGLTRSHMCRPISVPAVQPDFILVF